MKGIARSKTWILCGMMGALLMAAPYVEASRDDDDYDKKASKTSKKSKVKVEVKYEIETGLIQCDDVFSTGCGTDPLIGGKVKIEKDGRVEVHVAGAVPSATYDVVYESLDGSTMPIGQITTDTRGNARMTWWDFFAAGHTDAGNLMLERGGVTQFVSGFTVLH